MQIPPGEYRLGEPLRKGSMSVEETLFRRRSTRSFAAGSLSREQTAALLFAAQGITRSRGRRTAPSAGALYPLEIFMAAGETDAAAPGVYRYVPYTHALVPSAQGDRRDDIARAALGQMWAAEAQTILVICAVYERVTAKYGSRGRRYVHIEAGTASQNIALAAAACGVGTTVIGAFEDEKIARLIGANKDEKPLVVQPAGLLRG